MLWLVQNLTEHIISGVVYTRFIILVELFSKREMFSCIKARLLRLSSSNVSFCSGIETERYTMVNSTIGSRERISSLKK
jgi:hypothetical protein